MRRESHVRFREGLGLKCHGLLYGIMDKESEQTLAGYLTLGCSIFILAHFAPDIIDGYKSKSWPCANAKILHAEVKKGRKTYSSDIVYEYHVNGVRYVSERIWFGNNGPSGSESNVKSWIRLNLGNDKIDACYDSSDPRKSVLYPGFTWYGFIGAVLGLVLFTFGAFLLALQRIRAIKNSERSG